MDYLSSTRLVQAALEYYGRRGYLPIDVPVCVSEEVSAMTKPEDSNEIYHDSELVYVASAEQSFIQLHSQGILPDGKYMALTSCMRDEPIHDELHLLSFIKLELIIVGESKEQDIISCATDFFEHFSGKESLCVVKSGDNSDVTDLELGGIELGSYGTRSMMDGTVYTFGTGLAEPRFTTALNQYKA